MPSECTALASTKPVKVVYGPGTFINTAAERINQGILAQSQQAQTAGAAAETAARELAKAKGYSKARAGPARRRGGQARAPAVHLPGPAARAAVRAHEQRRRSTTPDFVSQLMFDPTQGRERAEGALRVPRAEPARGADPGAAEAEPERSSSSGGRSRWSSGRRRRSASSSMSNGQHYVVSGVPVVADALAQSVQHAIFVLLVAVLLVMAAVLALVFRRGCGCCRWRSRSAAAGARVRGGGARGRQPHDGVGRRAAGADRPGGGLRDPVPRALRGVEPQRAVARAEAAPAAAALGGPTIATAGLATAVGFLVLLLSPVPMVRGFGGVLVLGIALALRVRAHRRLRGARALRRVRARRRPTCRRSCRACAPAARGTRPAPRRGRRAWSRASQPVRAALRHGDRSAADRAAVGLLLAAARLGRRHADQGRSPTSASSCRRTCPRSRTSTSCSRPPASPGEIDVMVRANDLTDPSVVELDDGLRVARAGGARLQGRRHLHPGQEPARALPGVLAAGSVQRPPRTGITRASIKRSSPRSRPTSRRACSRPTTRWRTWPSASA